MSNNPIREIEYAAKYAADAYQEMIRAKAMMKNSTETFEMATTSWLELSKSLTEKINTGLLQAGVAA